MLDAASKRWTQLSVVCPNTVPVYTGALLTGGYVPNSPEEKKLVLARVRRLRGQVDALERALDAGVDCAPVLQQIAAVRGAVNGLMAGVLESQAQGRIL
ncbi:metal-sensing transcriptional repressor [Paraburkholderia sp. MM5477-R1]|uniref:metal-sensing transcriptional repressor n=1 Tax=Paraburkholderia sp. MM5477-R1 TaxID=2991062 RepID=UPI003D1E9D0A